ncbi:hypothetical protein GQ44DRAFT_665841 [Phaeosphaeriaceae sp. PMI808]|nr:hypothetical protein GQ44DRAFT_665841 [Phaeosphaeriaceae sp. PMI808]
MLEKKPLVSGNGIDINISLIEPVLFLQGFEQRHTSEPNIVVLRGSLNLRVRKPAKIKAITLKFHGKAVTKWPEGIPPRKVTFEETNTILNYTWSFFSAQFLRGAAGASADQVELFKQFPGSVPIQQGLLSNPSNTPSRNLGSRKMNWLLLQANPLWTFLRGGSSTNGPSTARKGYRIFYPGDYIYSFEFLLDSHLPETIDLKLGSVKYELEAMVERAGTFCANLVGSKEVTLTRTPAEGSLEQIEPIVINRIWKEQLHISIIVSGKSFPLGAQVPISLKLTPLAKVRFHWIKVFVTEHVEYFCSNKRVHRMEPVRKIQLFEKLLDVPTTNTISGSLMRTAPGRVVTSDQDSASCGVQMQEPADRVSGLGEGVTIGCTEMEILLRLPSCDEMKDNKDKSSGLHSDTTCQNIRVRHWIKVILRLSRPDPNHSHERRYIDISIDSPFRILSHQVTEANTTLPVYPAPQTVAISQMREHDCPGASPVYYAAAPFRFVPISNTLAGSQEDLLATPLSSGPATLRQVGTGGSVDPSSPRPTHLFRAPSSDPPTYEDEALLPSLEAPPPLYESLAH